MDAGPDGLGENLLAAAKRELLEETLVDADKLGIPVFEARIETNKKCFLRDEMS